MHPSTKKNENNNTMLPIFWHISPFFLDSVVWNVLYHVKINIIHMHIKKEWASLEQQKEKDFFFLGT